MAALLLSVGGAAFGGAVFGPVGAIVGRIAGAVAGNVIDHALFGANTTRHVEGPRLSDLDVMASTEGAPIPRVYGRARLSGQVIWATPFEEMVTTRTDTAAGKGGGAGGATTTTTYSYFANFAVGLCTGPIARVARVWADGKPLDLDGIDLRVYRGDESQAPDGLIVAHEGADNAPAYRGLAYVVFERLALDRFGNRIPQLSFEVVRPIGRLEQMIPGGDAHSRHHRVRLRPRRRGSGARSRPVRQREPPHRGSGLRRAGITRRPGRDLSEARAGRGGGGVVRQ